MAKTGVYNPCYFLAEIVTTKIWPCGVLDYSSKNDNWTITPLNHISLMPQYYFFFNGVNYNEEKTSHSKKKIKYKRGVIKVYVRPWMAWYYKIQSCYKN